MSDNILTLRNIETYYGPILAIKGISLDVQEGKIVTILGANGAGKTTILKTISGAMDPQKGKIESLNAAIAGSVVLYKVLESSLLPSESRISPNNSKTQYLDQTNDGE